MFPLITLVKFQIHRKMFYKALLSMICTSMQNLTCKNVLLDKILGIPLLYVISSHAFHWKEQTCNVMLFHFKKSYIPLIWVVSLVWFRLRLSHRYFMTWKIPSNSMVWYSRHFYVKMILYNFNLKLFSFQCAFILFSFLNVKIKSCLKHFGISALFFSSNYW